MSSKVRRIVGGAVAAVGIASIVPGALAIPRVRAGAEAAKAAEHVRLAAVEDLRRDEQELRMRTADAAAIPPFQAALEGKVDGPTLIDLFQSEDWWRPYRGRPVTVRVIVGGELLASSGDLAIGTQDQALVSEARRSGMASGRLAAGGRPCVAAVARVSARAGEAPVLIFVEAVNAAKLAAATAAPAVVPVVPQLYWGGMYGGGGLAFVGLLLVAWPGRRRSPADDADADADYDGGGGEGLGKHPTLKFGTTAAARVAPGFVPPTPGFAASSPARVAIAATARATAPATAATTGPAAASVVTTGGRATAAAPVAPATATAAATASAAKAPAAASASSTASASAVPSAAPATISASLSLVPPPSEPNDTDPQIFGRYRLLDRLGQGGMSDVFTAMAYGVEGFSRTFVLKRLRPELAHDKEAVAQFVDEARLQASLVHSNIVPVFDFGRVGREYFLTQEYIRGRDIVRMLSRYYELTHRILEPEVSYYMIHETLQALAYAHNKRDAEGQPMGIVHRDVSPANILVSLAGEVKLFDFGIVKANGRRSQTQVGMVKGNANFMSPEQARGHAVDARSDLFSLGLVLYYCLTNKLLYDGDNDLDVLYRAATGPTAEDRAALAALPEPAATVLARVLSIKPGDRYADAQEFATALEPFARGGKTSTANLMRLLFGDELQSEAA